MNWPEAFALVGSLAVIFGALAVLGSRFFDDE